MILSLDACPGEDSNFHGVLTPLGPQPSASASSATWAGFGRGYFKSISGFGKCFLGIIGKLAVFRRLMKISAFYFPRCVFHRSMCRRGESAKPVFLHISATMRSLGTYSALEEACGMSMTLYGLTLSKFWIATAISSAIPTRSRVLGVLA